MSQLSLFDSRRPAERSPPDHAFIRKTLNRALRQVREAEVMPWDEDRAARWEREFPEVAAQLPAEERVVLLDRFVSEMLRLRSLPRI